MKQFTVFDELNNDFLELNNELNNEINLITDLLHENDNSTWRRLYIKSVFSNIDAHLSFMKAHIAKVGDIDHLGLSAEEEERIFGKKSGTKRNKPKRVTPFKENIFFALELYSQINYAFISLDRQSSEWRNMGTAIEIRNRITHPSRSSDIGVSKSELDICKNAYSDFYSTVFEIHKANVIALNNLSNSLSKQIGIK